MTGSPLPLPQPRAAWGISKKGSGSGHHVDTSRQHTHLQHQRVPQQRHLSCSLPGTLTRTATLTVTTKRHGHTAAQGRLLYLACSSPSPPQKPLPRTPSSGLCTRSPAWRAALALDPHSAPCTLRAGTLSPQLPPPIATCSISLYTDCWGPFDPTLPIHRGGAEARVGSVARPPDPGTSAPAQRPLRRALFHPSPPQSPDPGLTGDGAAGGGGSVGFSMGSSCPPPRSCLAPSQPSSDTLSICFFFFFFHTTCLLYS